MKIISWNVNGLNASLKKNLLDFIIEQDADAYCFQETKVSKEKIELMEKILKKASNYKLYWNSAVKKGYSGVLTLSKMKPLSIIKGLGQKDFDYEGRLLTLEFDDYYLINGYIPNAGRELVRLDFKIKYDHHLINFLDNLSQNKDIILTGDLNVAHKAIDLANPKSNERTAGYTIEEREAFTKLLERGYVDTFRTFVKEGGHYTYWSYRGKARERNVGWRLDYFVTNEDFSQKIETNTILKDVLGSDHAPILLKLK